ILISGVLALVYGAVTGYCILKEPTGTEKMKQIAAAIQEGAKAYLNRQYLTIGVVGAVIFVLLGIKLGWHVGAGFAIGAVLSGATGYIGMNISVRGNVRTTEAARSGGIRKALDIAFKSGAVTGMLVVGLGLIGVTGYYMYLKHNN